MAGADVEPLIKAEGWAGLRLDRALREAEAAGTAESWRRLRNLAAAYGCAELASRAAGKAAPPERRPPSRERARAEAAASRSAAPSPATRLRSRAVISSSTPLARIAWLRAWAAARGFGVEESKNGTGLVIESAHDPSALEALLGVHPEITWEREGS